MLVCKYIVCQSAKKYCKLIGKDSQFERIINDYHESAIYHRPHDIQLVKAYYIFVL